MAVITRNPLANSGFLEKTETFFNSGIGAYYSLKLGRDGLALGAEALRVNSSALPAVQQASQVCAAGAAALAIPQAGALTISAARAVASLPKFTEMSRSIIFDCFQKITDCISTIIASLTLFFTSGPGIKIAGDVFGAMADAGDAAIAADKLSCLKEADVKDISSDVKQAVSEEKNLYWIKMAKAATAVAGGALGIFGYALGTALVSTTFLLVLSVASTSFAIIKIFYDMSRVYSDDQLIQKIRAHNVRPVQS